MTTPIEGPEYWRLDYYDNDPSLLHGEVTRMIVVGGEIQHELTRYIPFDQNSDDGFRFPHYTYDTDHSCPTHVYAVVNANEITDGMERIFHKCDATYTAAVVRRIPVDDEWVDEFAETRHTYVPYRQRMPATLRFKSGKVRIYAGDPNDDGPRLWRTRLYLDEIELKVDDTTGMLQVLGAPNNTYRLRILKVQIPNGYHNYISVMGGGSTLAVFAVQLGAAAKKSMAAVARDKEAATVVVECVVKLSFGMRPNGIETKYGTGAVIVPTAMK